MEKVDWRVHRFFESCAHGNSSRICLDYADFSNVMTQVEEREFLCKTPMWLKKLKRKQPQRIEPTTTAIRIP